MFFQQNQQQNQHYLAHMQAMEILEEIFQCHGGVRLTTPLLMPRSSLYENNPGYVCMMDKSGTSVGMPFDLRVSVIASNFLLAFFKHQHVIPCHIASSKTLFHKY